MCCARIDCSCDDENVFLISCFFIKDSQLRQFHGACFTERVEGVKETLEFHELRVADGSRLPQLGPVRPVHPIVGAQVGEVLAVVEDIVAGIDDAAVDPDGLGREADSDAHVMVLEDLVEPRPECARLLFGDFAVLALVPAADETRQSRARRACVCLVCSGHRLFEEKGAVIFPEQPELERLVFAPELEKAGVEEDLGHDRELFHSVHILVGFQTFPNFIFFFILSFLKSK
jgi:hypothetical protein